MFAGDESQVGKLRSAGFGTANADNASATARSLAAGSRVLGDRDGSAFGVHVVVRPEGALPGGRALVARAVHSGVRHH